MPAAEVESWRGADSDSGGCVTTEGVATGSRRITSSVPNVCSAMRNPFGRIVANAYTGLIR
jgi:hypothetical protein